MPLLLCALLWAASERAQAQAKPVIVSEPQGQIVPLGATVTFTVVATGDEPLTYRWRRSGVTLHGETNATLVLTNVAFTNARAYTVIITNAFGGTMSRSAPLSVFTISRGPDGIGLDLYGLVGPDYVYVLQYVTTPGATNWTTLTNLSLPYSPYRFVDPEVNTTTERYYRAVLLPWY
jgi:hypothetical protein